MPCVTRHITMRSSEDLAISYRYAMSLSNVTMKSYSVVLNYKIQSY